MIKPAKDSFTIFQGASFTKKWKRTLGTMTTVIQGSVDGNILTVTLIMSGVVVVGQMIKGTSTTIHSKIDSTHYLLSNVPLVQLTQMTLIGPNPYDFTGCNFVAQFRLQAGSAVLIELNIANGGIIVDPTAGIWEFSMSTADTLALNFDVALWDLLVIPPTGKSYRLMEGRANLSKCITKHI